MKQTLATLAFTFLMLCTSASFAQNSFYDAPFASTNSETLVEYTTDNWTFYADEHNRVFYIDFENIKFNLSDVVVKNEDGEVVLRDDVLDLPVDTIYELDFNKYSSGKYLIELRSFTGIIKKEVDLE